MNKIKILSSNDYIDLEEKVNNFFKNNQHIYLKNIKFTTDKIVKANNITFNSFNAMIIYEEDK